MTRLRLPPRLIYNVNRVAIVTLGLQWIASPRIRNALPTVTTRAEAAGLLVVAIPLLGSLFFLSYFVTRFLLDAIAHVPHRMIGPRDVIGDVAKPQFSNEGSHRAHAA